MLQEIRFSLATLETALRGSADGSVKGLNSHLNAMTEAVSGMATQLAVQNGRVSKNERNNFKIMWALTVTGSVVVFIGGALGWAMQNGWFVINLAKRMPTP